VLGVRGGRFGLLFGFGIVAGARLAASGFSWLWGRRYARGRRRLRTTRESLIWRAAVQRSLCEEHAPGEDECGDDREPNSE
jgi:hypothetical protein